MKKHACRRLLAIGTVAALALTSSLTVYGSESTDAGKEIVFPLEETLEYTAFALKNQLGYGVDDKQLWTDLQENANIHFTTTSISAAEATEKASLIVAGGEYPDVFFNPQGMGLDCDKLGMDGIFIPLEDMIKEYAPNISALLDEYDGWYGLSSPDGHIYSLPYFNGKCIQGSKCMFIHKGWIDRLGLEEPGTLDELYEVLKAFKEQDANGNGDPNDEIPFVFAADDSTVKEFMPYLEDGLHYGATGHYIAIIDDELVFYPLTENFKNNYLALLRKWYEEGLIYENSFTQTYEQMRTLGNSGDIYGMFINYGINAFVPSEFNLSYNTYKPDNKSASFQNGVMNGRMSITDTCENPAELIAWADQFYTEEGSEMLCMGYEGEHYEINDDGTFNMINVDKYPDGAAQYGLDYELPMGMYPDLLLKINPDVDWNSATSSHLRIQRNGTFYKEYGKIMPSLKYSEDEFETITDLSTDINSYIDTYTAQVITGQKSLDDTWEEFENTLKQMNAEELYAAYKSAYDRAVAAE